MIELDSLSVTAGAFRVQQLCMSIPGGTYAVLMGATGQGKTTILEAICGLRKIDSGRILLFGNDVTNKKPADRCIGYVPQDLALFPSLNVREHLEFAMRIRKFAAARMMEQVRRLAAALEIEPLLNRSVRGLSGGEAQRVALGRALSFEPKLLLLDEPLNALDSSTKVRMCRMLKNIQQQFGVTTLHVTHSRREACLVADAYYLLQNGRISNCPLSDLQCDESETTLTQPT